MYEAEMKSQQANNYGIQAAGCVNSAPKPHVVADAMLREFHTLIEKARMVKGQQDGLRARLFGPSPQPEDCPNGKLATHQGFLPEANGLIQTLHDVMDSIIQNQIDLERLA